MSQGKKTSRGGERRVKMVVRRGTMILESDRPRRTEIHLAPPKEAERRHARPGSGIKRARAVMLPKPR
jgi:hypothetical protein